MICPQCVEEGIKSRVDVGMSATTDMYCPSYYDEDGVYHHHDMNTRSTSYTCSNGHSFGYSGHPACPAGDYAGISVLRVDGRRFAGQ